jgi:uncharacterized protein
MSPVPDLYRRWISPLLHSISGVSGACRFQPTCSEYAMTAVARHGVLCGAALALWRVLRCNPFARGGFDPVPGTYPVAPLPLPDFLSSFVGSLNLMRLSLKKGAHAVLSRAAYRKFGVPHR